MTESNEEIQYVEESVIIGWKRHSWLSD
jgi:hypothetical protein